tara:strand:+ start:679 stop:1932 length:1254 start_codon:yes stop_codon:yes gene_type:complete
MLQKVILTAPVLTRSGYGEQSRFALRALRSRPDLFDIYIHPLEWGKTSWISEDNEERKWIDQTIQKTIDFLQVNNNADNNLFDVSLQVTIPNEWQDIAKHNVGYTAGIETTKVAHEWLLKGNEMDSIIVVSDHSKNIYRNTVYDAHNQQTGEDITLSLNTQVSTVNYPVKTYDNLEALELNLKHDFNFVTVAQMGPRKNIDNTINWFLQEFHDDEVGLVVKTNVAKNCQLDKEIVHGSLMRLIRAHDATNENRKCKLYLLHGDLTDQEMHELYLNPKIKATVCLTHGEGFGLPMFESAYMGVPVVATDWSGQLDFLCDSEKRTKFYNVGFDLQPVPDEILWDGVIVKGSMWAVPRENSAKYNMRLCYDEVTDGTNTACEYSKELCERFSEDKMYAAFIEAMNLPIVQTPESELVEFE